MNTPNTSTLPSIVLIQGLSSYTSTELISVSPCVLPCVLVLRAYRSTILMNTSQDSPDIDPDHLGGLEDPSEGPHERPVDPHHLGCDSIQSWKVSREVSWKLSRTVFSLKLLFLPAAKLSGLREHFTLRSPSFSVVLRRSPSFSVCFIICLISHSLVSYIGDGYSDIMDIWTCRTWWIFGHHGYLDIMDIRTSWILGHHEYLDIMDIQISFILGYHR